MNDASDQPSRLWLVEHGIGEDRAILLDPDDNAIVAARLCWREPWRAGAVVQARLDHHHAGTRHGAVQLPDGTIAKIDALPTGIADGAALMVRISRAAIAEHGRFKLAQCRPAGAIAAAPAPGLAAQLASQSEIPVRIAGPLDRTFANAGWDTLIDQAQSGVIDFQHTYCTMGRITISPTPAMTLIDIDGPPPVTPLAQAAVPAIAGALARMDIGGSVAIDFPGLEARADRQAVDVALELALAQSGWRGERTAMNGFGLVQVISRLERPSLIARMAYYPARAAAHALLRQAERVDDAGALLLVAHPAVLAMVTPPMEAELARRTARVVRREPRPGLALTGGFAQTISV